MHSLQIISKSEHRIHSLNSLFVNRSCEFNLYLATVVNVQVHRA